MNTETDNITFKSGDKITEIPAELNRVKIVGYGLAGEGRSLGYRLMNLAIKLNCSSPGNVYIPGKEESLSMNYYFTKQEDFAELISFLNSKLRDGCKVIFSKK